MMTRYVDKPFNQLPEEVRRGQSVRNERTWNNELRGRPVKLESRPIGRRGWCSQEHYHVAGSNMFVCANIVEEVPA